MGWGTERLAKEDRNRARLREITGGGRQEERGNPERERERELGGKNRGS